MAGARRQYRAGLGYDIHCFIEGRPLMLGGVRVDYPRGLAGHSDADVVVHAVCDALLGAAGLGDIGEHFPNTDPVYKDANSVVLLREVVDRIADRGFRVENVDVVIQAEEPNVKRYKPAMRKAIARPLGIAPQDVNIKATTQEGLGAIGRKEGIAAFAQAFIYRDRKD